MCEIIKHEILKISSEFKCDRVSDISHLSVFWFLTEMQIYYVQLAVLAEIKGHLKNWKNLYDFLTEGMWGLTQPLT